MGGLMGHNDLRTGPVSWESGELHGERLGQGLYNVSRETSQPLPAIKRTEALIAGG